jgi:hypothetical protein
MKKFSLLILLIAFTFGVQAQNPPKYQVERAAVFADYISEKMDLNDDDKAFVMQVMLDRVVGASKRVKGQNLSTEDKRAIYKDEYAKAQEKLAQKYDKKTSREMMALSNEARKQADNNK